MDIVCITSDKYRHLVHGFAEAFNEHWPSKGQPVTVLCYQRPEERLPKNFRCVGLGCQEEFGSEWTTALIPYFEKYVGEQFILFLEDYWLTHVNASRLWVAVDVMCDSKTIGKFDLTTDRKKFPHRRLLGDIIESDQRARYRSSLQAAIWRTRYFRRFLVPGRTPWEFELLGEREAMNDKVRILGTERGVLQYANVMLKGART